MEYTGQITCRSGQKLTSESRTLAGSWLFANNCLTFRRKQSIKSKHTVYECIWCVIYISLDVAPSDTTSFVYFFRLQKRVTYFKCQYIHWNPGKCILFAFVFFFCLFLCLVAIIHSLFWRTLFYVSLDPFYLKMSSLHKRWMKYLLLIGYESCIFLHFVAISAYSRINLLYELWSIIELFDVREVSI